MYLSLCRNLEGFPSTRSSIVQRELGCCRVSCATRASGSVFQRIDRALVPHMEPKPEPPALVLLLLHVSIQYNKNFSSSQTDSDSESDRRNKVLDVQPELSRWKMENFAPISVSLDRNRPADPDSVYATESLRSDPHHVFFHNRK